MIRGKDGQWPKFIKYNNAIVKNAIVFILDCYPTLVLEDKGIPFWDTKI